MAETVLFARMLEYESRLLDTTVGLLLDECRAQVRPGMRVLVKPNFVSLVNSQLSCTHPRVIAAACSWLIDQGARPTVADSPAFGSARAIARVMGLNRWLAPMGVPVRGLGRPTPLTLTSGHTIGLSRRAREADLILNLPRLKAHCQMRVTGAVKNCFGCVSGWRKAVAHARFGHDRQLFAAMIMDVMAALPRTVHLMDGVHAMHVTGPIRGKSYPLGLLAASGNGVALDTAVYSLLGLSHTQVPLWAEARIRNLPGTDAGELAYPLEPPSHFKAKGFQVPEELDDISFAPMRLVKGRMRSLLHRFKR